MKIRQVDTTHADQLSARVFFDALCQFWDVSEMDVLDAFARNGQLTVGSYHKKLRDVTRLECWELGAEHKQALQQFTMNVKIGCSYGLAQYTKNEYDLIVIDTPQGLHNSDDGVVCCEHFDFLPLAVRKLRPGGVVVLYVNKAPYDKNVVGSQGYDEYAEYDFKKWMKRRENFYGAAKINEENALTTYRYVIKAMGRKVGRTLMIPCFSDVPGKEPYAFRLALEVL